jgi:hypothetical protein
MVDQCIGLVYQILILGSWVRLPDRPQPFPFASRAKSKGISPLRFEQKMRLGHICDVYYMEARTVQRGELLGLVSAENCDRHGLCHPASHDRANLPICCLDSRCIYCTSLSPDPQVVPIKTLS